MSDTQKQTPESLLEAPEKVPGLIPEPEKPTIGEKLFHKATYTGVGYFANFMLSVVLWDFFAKVYKDGAIFKGLANGVTKAAKSMGISAEAAKKIGDGGAKYFFSPLGGHLLMAPIKWMEDNARWLTHKANVMLDRNYQYKDLDVTRQSDEKELPPLVDEPTKQTWGQIAIRRAFSWGMVIAAGIGLQNIKLGGIHKKLTGVSVEKGIEDGFVWMVNKGVDRAPKGGLLDRARNTDIGKRYLKLSALDSALTVLTASIISMTKNWFGKDKDVNGNGAHTQEEAAPSIDRAAATAAAEPAPGKVFADESLRKPIGKTAATPSESWTEAEHTRVAHTPEMQVSV